MVILSVLLYGCITFILLKHLEQRLLGNYMRIKCFEQILEAVPYKTAAIQPLTSYLTAHPVETSKTCLAMFSCGLLHINTPVLANQLSSALCGYWMLSRGFSKSNGP